MGGGGEGGRQGNGEKIIIKNNKNKETEKRHLVQSQSVNRWVFRRLPNAAKEYLYVDKCIPQGES